MAEIGATRQVVPRIGRAMLDGRARGGALSSQRSAGGCALVRFWQDEGCDEADYRDGRCCQRSGASPVCRRSWAMSCWPFALG